MNLVCLDCHWQGRGIFRPGRSGKACCPACGYWAVVPA